MTPLVAFKPYNAYMEIAATAPADWAKAKEPISGHSFCLMLCDEKDVKMLCKNDNRKRIEQAIGCKLIPFLGDAVRQGQDIVSRLGGPPVITSDIPMPDATWTYWPVYPTPYDGPEVKRSGIMFGGRFNYAKRQELLDELRGMGIHLIERDDAIRSYDAYALNLKSAEAVINLCADRKTGKPQLKARPIEACLAGALLLEEKNPFTSRWLVSGVEYLEWESIQHLKSLIEDIRRCPQQARTIALAGSLAVRERLNTRRFWQTVEGLAA